MIRAHAAVARNISTAAAKTRNTPDKADDAGFVFLIRKEEWGNGLRNT